jgi:hypothetical protein
MQMIVTTAIAGAVVASKPAAAIPIADQREEASKQPKDDEKLLNLAEQYLAAWAELDRRCSIKSRMEEKQFAIKKPEKMKVRAEDSELGIPIFFGKPVSDGDFYTPLDIDRMRKPKWSVGERRDEKDDGFTVTILYVEPAAQARERADEIVAAYDAWKNACKRPRGMLTAELRGASACWRRKSPAPQQPRSRDSSPRRDASPIFRRLWVGATRVHSLRRQSLTICSP